MCPLCWGLATGWSNSGRIGTPKLEDRCQVKAHGNLGRIGTPKPNDDARWKSMAILAE